MPLEILFSGILSFTIPFLLIWVCLRRHVLYKVHAMIGGLIISICIYSIWFVSDPERLDLAGLANNMASIGVFVIYISGVCGGLFVCKLFSDKFGVYN